jgi:hypothetical protein
MNRLLLLGLILMNFSATIAQLHVSNQATCAAVTQRIIEQRFSVEDQLALNAAPEKLARLNYMYAYSYEFTSDQMILKSQKMLFNVEKYNALRMPSQRVKIMDPESGLTVELYSWNEVEQALDAISAQFHLADSQ